MVSAEIDPNSGDLVQQEQPQPLPTPPPNTAEEHEHTKTCNISETVQDMTKVTMTD